MAVVRVSFPAYVSFLARDFSFLPTKFITIKGFQRKKHLTEPLEG